jgi:deoxyribonuclease V
MNISNFYPSSLLEAAETQKVLANKVILEDDFAEISLIGGMDVSNNPYDPKQLVYATTITLDINDLQVQEVVNHCQQQTFPYRPGFLGFREAPVLLETWKELKNKPQLILVDGHGVSHPRSLGIASHIGVLLDWPTIGVAKNILVGKPAAVLGNMPGDQVDLIWKGKKIGILLRTRLRSNPLIISSGHKVSVDTALRFVLHCLKGYRLPEPTRQAHIHANLFRKNYAQS